MASGHGETAETLTQGPGAWQKFDTAAKRPKNLTQEGGPPAQRNLTQGGGPRPRPKFDKAKFDNLTQGPGPGQNLTHYPPHHGGRGPPRGGAVSGKTCRFFPDPRAVPRRRRRCPSTPPASGRTPRATFGPWVREGSASKAVRVLILGGTPVGAFAPPSTSHVI